MTCQDHPFGQPQLGPSHHGIAVTVNLEVRMFTQSCFHGIGQPGLIAGDGLDVDQRGRQLGGIGAQVQAGGGAVGGGRFGARHDLHPIQGPGRRPDRRMEP